MINGACYQKRENMEDLSLHILDIIENSMAAGATKIDLEIDEMTTENRLMIKIKDNGRGMDKETLRKALDPFYTTKKTRSVGLGLSMLSQAAKEADGSFRVDSEPGQGTNVTAEFVYDHLDRKPLGNMVETIVACLVSLSAGADLKYRHCRDGKEFIFDTREVRNALSGVPISNAEVISFLKEHIKDGLDELSKRSNK